MRGFHHIQSGIAGMDPWVLVLVVLGGIFLISFLVIAAIRRHNIGSDGLTPAEKKSLPREQREVLTMLRQHGGTMVQTEVADNIAGDMSYVVAILSELEERGKITRQWNADSGAFLVSAVS